MIGIIRVQVVLASVLTAIDWRLYFFFWILPLVTLTAFFHRAKGFIDHAMLPGESPSLAYSYRVGALDRAFSALSRPITPSITCSRACHTTA